MIISLPRRDETIDTLLRGKYLSSLYLCSGYWQIEINEADNNKAAFIVGNMRFLSMLPPGFNLTKLLL